MYARPLRAQLKGGLGALALLYVPLALLATVATYMSVSHGLPVKVFFQDAAVIGGLPAYAGSLSTVGVVLWCAAATVCFLTAAVLWTVRGRRADASFLFAFGAVSAVLMADDAFMIHDALAPYYLGVSSREVYAVYLVLVLAALVSFRRTILQTDYVLLVAALGFLGASVVLDVLADTGVLRGLGLHSEDMEFFLEDGCKLLGIGGWFGYLGWVCFSYLAAMARPSVDPLESPTAGVTGRSHVEDAIGGDGAAHGQRGATPAAVGQRSPGPSRVRV